MLVITDATRDQYFYLAQDLFLQLPRAINYFVCTLVCSALLPSVDIAGFAYGMVGSLHSFAPVLARAVFNPVYAYLPLLTRDTAGALSMDKYYLHETDDFRLLLIAASVLFAAICVLACPLSLLLPDTVPVVHNLQEHCTRNKNRCICTTCCLALLVSVVLVAATIAIIPAESNP